LTDDGVAAIAEQLLAAWPQGQADQDQLARLAAAALRAPAALITVLDGTEQRLVGAFGPEALLGDRSDLPPGPWCHRVLAENRPLFVSDGGAADALAACRFRVRATAGHPLCDEQGQAIGSLCILDDEPRAWPESDRHLVALLAGTVERAVLARRRARHSAAELHRESRRHRLLSAAQSAINRRLDPASELQALARAVVPELADVATVHVLDRPVPPGRAPAMPVRTHRVAAEAIDGVAAPATFQEVVWFAEDPIPQAIQRGQLFQWPMAADPVPRWSLRTGTAATFRGGMNRLLLAPVLVNDRVAAVATFGLCGDRPSWGAEDLQIIQQITEHAAHALEQGLVYEQSRRTALVLQRSLLSEPPQVDGLQVCVRYEPAGRDEVGGDWYDAFELEPGRLVLAVGDVVGHDITAAAAMGQLRAVLRTLAMEQDLPAGAVLDRLAEANRCLHITPFATAVFARLVRKEPREWVLSWASAGHLPPILLEPGRPSRVLEQQGGLALAPSVNAPRTTQTLTLARPGSTVLLYTDGLVERRGIDIDAGMTDLCRRADALADLPLAVLCDHFVREAPHRDDAALLAIRID
jgi:serine phosphatase RsbU (regulator of sigma subunit)